MYACLKAFIDLRSVFHCPVFFLSQVGCMKKISMALKILKIMHLKNPFASVSNLTWILHYISIYSFTEAKNEQNGI
jgi:hypothetical protein